MTGPKASIRQAWHDVLVYDEGDGRTIEFSCPSMVTPPQVSLPAPEFWAARMPAWAHDRREEIVGRLRDAGAIILEHGANITTIRAPDGTFRVECLSEPEERGLPFETTRIVTLPGDRVLLHLPLYAVFGAPSFADPGTVVLPLRYRYGQLCHVRVDIRAGTFVLNPNDAPAPVSALFERLQSLLPQPMRPGTLPALPRRTLRVRTTGDIAAALGSLAFVAAGLWIILTSRTLRDELLGFAAAMFFALCAAVTMFGTRRAPRNFTPPQPRSPSLRIAGPYLPLVLALAQIPWLVLLFFGLLFVVGDAPFTATAAKERLFSYIAATPAGAGLVLGLVGIACGWAHGPTQWACMLLGMAICAASFGGFVWGYFG